MASTYKDHIISFLTKYKIFDIAFPQCLRLCWHRRWLSNWCMCVRVCMLSHFSRVQLFATLWTVPCQTSLFMGFSRQEYWSGLPFLNPGDLPHPGIEPTSLTSPALAGRFFTTSATWKAHPFYKCCLSKHQENIRYLHCFERQGIWGARLFQLIPRPLGQ